MPNHTYYALLSPHQEFIWGEIVNSRKFSTSELGFIDFTPNAFSRINRTLLSFGHEPDMPSGGIWMAIQNVGQAWTSNHRFYEQKQTAP